ncbi:MAG: cysteine peptidase family C39 domain-containing protein [Nitrosomonadaceae bacterium]
MDLIKQRDEYDCGVACIAMYLDITYGEAASLVDHKAPGMKEGLTADNIVECLRYECGDVVVNIDRPITTTNAILLVPSLNHEDGLHFVVYDSETKRIRDPQFNTGKRFYDIPWQKIPNIRAVITLANTPRVINYIRRQVKRYAAML